MYCIFSFPAMAVASLNTFVNIHIGKGVEGSELFLKLLRKDKLYEASNSQFLWNSITPYVSFFIFTVCAAAMYPICYQVWIPHSFCCVVALFFTGTLSSEFSVKRDVPETMVNVQYL